MCDEKAEKNGRPEENRSKRTVEEDREGHRACEKGSRPEFQHRGCGEEIPRKPGNVRRADRARFRPTPPSHRMGRSASAGLTPLRHSYAPSAHSQAHPVRRFALNPARTACRDRAEGAADQEGARCGRGCTSFCEIIDFFRRPRTRGKAEKGSVSARFLVHQTHSLRRVGHLDSLVLEASFDLEVDLLDTGEIFRVVEVLAPVGDIENQR